MCGLHVLQLVAKVHIKALHNSCPELVGERLSGLVTQYMYYTQCMYSALQMCNRTIPPLSLTSSAQLLCNVREGVAYKWFGYKHICRAELCTPHH